MAELQGEDDEDTGLLRDMAEGAHKYIESFPGCVAVTEGYFGGGVGGIFGIFLFRIVPRKNAEDEWMWVVTGDLPSMYLHWADAQSPKDVFDVYVSGLGRWAKFARSGNRQVPPDVPPLGVPATREWADEVERRMTALKEIIGPIFG